MPRWQARSGGGNTNWTITREHDAPATRHENGFHEGRRSQSIAGLKERSKAAAHLAKTGCLHCGARSGWPYGKIPTDVAVAATDPERGLLAHQAVLQVKGWRALTETLGNAAPVGRARPHLHPHWCADDQPFALKVVPYSIHVNNISVWACWERRRARYQCRPSFEPSAAAVMIAGIPIATAASAIARASIMAIPLESASSQNV